MGFSILASFRSVFALKTFLLFVVVPVFPSFLPKIKQFTFLCGSLCSQMLGYFTSFYFTVNPGQTAVCDSGFLIDIYSYRGAFYKRKISLIVLYCYSIEDLCDRFFGELFFKFTVWSLFSRYHYNVWHLD